MLATLLIITYISTIIKPISGQGCSNTCPPLNFGKVVPSLCENDLSSTFADVTKTYEVCHPPKKDSPNGKQSFNLSEFQKSNGYEVTVLANYYTGCNAGRRESGVFAHVAQRYYNEYKNKVMFIQSVKGGGSCKSWSDIYQEDALDLYPNSEVKPKEMPVSVDDVDYELRDDYFTAPFGHPSYVILDGDLRVRHKFVGPCCGYEGYYDCTKDIAKELDNMLTGHLDEILKETDIDDEAPTASPINDDDEINVCEVDEYSEWSSCSITCGQSGNAIMFRYRNVIGDNCTEANVETKSCQPDEAKCDDIQCIPEFGQSPTLKLVSSGFNSPKDVEFHPTPGLHLQDYSEGRTFHPDSGEEAWVVNSGNHSISIVASLNTEYQTTISRRDRGYYHYMINGAAISFNSVKDSDRSPDRDSLNYWAICNDNDNTYLDTKEPNYFMGPTLYDSKPNNKNTVNKLGDICHASEPCFFLHSDMLHESSSCVGIVHDSEKNTAYGNVYFAFDSTMGQLVRFDFQQPHGPGSMDHSIASVRRYTEIKLNRGYKHANGIHAGMVVHKKRRELYISSPGDNKIIVVGADSGSYARTAREEYPIFSNSLPSFEYSIWECVDSQDFITGIQTPTGLALDNSQERLFIAERDTGNILVYDVSSVTFLYKYETGLNSIGGLTFSPKDNTLYFVDEDTNSLYTIQSDMDCTTDIPSRMNKEFEQMVSQAQLTLQDSFSLMRDYSCKVDPIIPDTSFFEQVHNDTGYADPDSQTDGNIMNPDAILLANRTDCGYKSDLNFDALLLGGYLCHVCLPETEQTCEDGGVCSNVQWRGFVCSNEYYISKNELNGYILQHTNETSIDVNTFGLKRGITYRFDVLIDDVEICMNQLPSSYSEICASSGPLILPSERTINEGNEVVFTQGDATVFRFALVDNVTKESKKPKKKKRKKKKKRRKRKRRKKKKKMLKTAASNVPSNVPIA